jgi:hypothetical protein
MCFAYITVYNTNTCETKRIFVRLQIMKKTKHTTVILSNSVQKIKEDLTPIYGLKNILSAGLLLFSRLSDIEQKKTIASLHDFFSDELDDSARRQIERFEMLMSTKLSDKDQQALNAFIKKIKRKTKKKEK